MTDREATALYRLMSRRRFLQSVAAASAAVAAGGVLAACSSSGSPSPAGDAASAAPTSASSAAGGGGGNLGAYANKSMAFFFFVALDEALKRATESAGFEYQSINAEFDASKQAESFNSLLLKKPAFLTANAIDSAMLKPLIEKYAAAGIPVGIVDSPLSEGKAQITVSYDNFKGGEMAAQKIVDLLTKKYGEPKGKVLNAYGSLVPEAWRLRYEGWNTCLSKYPGIQNIGRPTQGSEENARALTQAALAEFPDLDAAHSPSDTLTRGVLNAFKAAGKLVPAGQDGHIIVTSIDGEPMSLEWVRQGFIDAEVSQDPVAYAQICVEMLVNYSLKGKVVEPGTYTNDKYFWKTAPIVDSATGPAVVQPPYYIETAAQADDPRQWGNVVTKEWGMKA